MKIVSIAQLCLIAGLMVQAFDGNAQAPARKPTAPPAAQAQPTTRPIGQPVAQPVAQPSAAPVAQPNAVATAAPPVSASNVPGLFVVDEAALAEFQRNPDWVRKDQATAYRVTAAILTKYFNELQLYYMQLYKLREPPVDNGVLTIYLSWLKTLPTPVVNDLAKSSIVHHAVTIAYLSKLAVFEARSGKPISVTAPPPFIVNTTLVGPDGIAVPIKTKEAADENKPAEIIAPRVTTETVEEYARKVTALEKNQANQNIILMALGALALVGIIIGYLGFRAATR